MLSVSVEASCAGGIHKIHTLSLSLSLSLLSIQLNSFDFIGMDVATIILPKHQDIATQKIYNSYG